MGFCVMCGRDFSKEADKTDPREYVDYFLRAVNNLYFAAFAPIVHQTPGKEQFD